MQKIAIFAGLVATGVTIYSFAKKAKAVTGLVYEFTNLKVEKLDFSNTRTKAGLSINNPSSTALTFENFFGNVSYKGTHLAVVKIKQKATIDARDVTILQFPLTLKTANLLSVGVDLIQNPVLEKVRISGSITLDGIDYPVDQEISVG